MQKCILNGKQLIDNVLGKLVSVLTFQYFVSGQEQKQHFGKWLIVAKSISYWIHFRSMCCVRAYL